MNELTIATDLIHQAVNNYYVGVSTGNVEMLMQAFDTSAGHLKGVQIDGNGKELVAVEPISGSIERWSKRPYQTGSGNLLSTEIIEGKMATVKFAFTLDDNHFLDLLTLYKVNGEWKIVNKMFVVLDGAFSLSNALNETN